MSKITKAFGLAACLLAAALIFTSCGERGGNNPTPTGPTITYKLSIVQGNFQTSALDSPFPVALRVFVTDDVGVKQSGAVIRWSVIEGYADIASTRTATDGDGFAETTVTPVDYAGEITVQAKVQYTDVAVTFTLTGT